MTHTGRAAVSVFAGIFWRDHAHRARAAETAARIEELGYAGLWLSAGHERGLPDVFDDLLGATRSIPVGAGILSIWHTPAEEAAATFARLESAHPGRFVLGLGASHPTAYDAYAKPYTRMREYLDALDRATPPVPHERRVVAALGPRMLALAADRSRGAFPYFVTPEHTALARDRVGPDAWLMTEQAVLLETDPDTARRVGREHMTYYLQQPNYTRALRDLGYDDADLADGGSDRLVDALVAWGDEAAVAERVAAHHAAGADDVAIQVLTSGADDFATDDYARLAPALL